MVSTAPLGQAGEHAWWVGVWGVQALGGALALGGLVMCESDGLAGLQAG